MNFIARFLFDLQEMSLLAGRAARGIFKKPHYVPEAIAQMDYIGVGSLTIIILTGFFTGGVLTLQTYQTLESYGAVDQLGYLVSISLVRELGPVLSALMVTGRVVSAISAELGSMVVSEQIDAMRALGTNPMRKLVTPRVISTVVMLFFLTIISDAFGIAGGGVASSLFFGVDFHQYWSTAWQILVFQDVFMGLAKPVLFGFIISSIGCYYGISARGGTQGVGRATTQAVVASSILIITVDFFVTRLSMTLFGG